MKQLGFIRYLFSYHRYHSAGIRTHVSQQSCSRLGPLSRGSILKTFLTEERLVMTLSWFINKLVPPEVRRANEVRARRGTGSSRARTGSPGRKLPAPKNRARPLTWKRSRRRRRRRQKRPPRRNRHQRTKKLSCQSSFSSSCTYYLSALNSFMCYTLTFWHVIKSNLRID